MAFGTSDYIAPFARIDARNASLVVGSGTTIQDNATIVANPRKLPKNPALIIGDNVFIGPGATVLGPGTIGAPNGAAVSIGANAVVDTAVIQPGAQVGAMARVEPGIVIATGFRVLPGADVRTQAEASDPALGKVAKLTGTDATLTQILSDNTLLATGYTALFQGNSATGANPGTTATTVFNGSLAPVEGSSPSPSVSFATTASPKYFAPGQNRTRAYTSPFFGFRSIGSVTYSNDTPFAIQKHVGFGTSIRSDEDLPMTLGTVNKIGKFVTIHGFRGGKITTGTNLTVGGRVVLTANSSGNLALGKNVNVGSSSVLLASSIGDGVTIGQGSYIANSTIAANTVIPAGSILINNKIVGTVGY
jgi:carbonic anhydrase/acetyltransferase-like protein (isoleucine patch superfamily)